MKSKSPPPPPNPNKVIKTQSEANEKTATANFERSLVNQDTPFGTLNWSKGDDGRWMATTQFTPDEQKLLDTWEAYGAKANTAADEWMSFINGMNPGDFDLSDTTIDSTILDAYRPEYDETYDRSRNQRVVELANKGIKEGSTAFDAAMRDFDLNWGDAWSRLARDARTQAISQIIQQRNQPFNELALLRQGLTLPQGMNFVGTPSYQQPFTDTAGITQQGYQNQYNAWAQEQADRNAMMSGLFQLGGTGIGGALGGPLGASLGGSVGGWVGPGGTGTGLHPLLR